MKAIPFIILVLWLIALTLGVLGVVTRRKKLILWGGVAALGGVAATYYLKWLLQNM
ncbi:DNA repair protein [Desulforamulus ferrireducens]|uniref:DNA repair protein n=1 Tax=Desulforamulus ferrireducens TaxID=1833852 RepID=A0A1S6IT56_9FIRM|nr:DNA repair protein [Desulforamulus ferrireducens]AQS57945.1 DNA repair protein [Desulforamulus ferrireducens]